MEKEKTKLEDVLRQTNENDTAKEILRIVDLASVFLCIYALFYLEIHLIQKDAWLALRAALILAIPFALVSLVRYLIKAPRPIELFDFYGDVLTDRQKEFYDLYYNEDLSLAEIAENYGISRQGVRDVIVRAEAAMTEIEDKTHIIRRFKQTQKDLAAIEEIADRLLKAVNNRSYNEAMLDEIGHSIKEYTAKLKQE